MGCTTSSGIPAGSHDTAATVPGPPRLLEERVRPQAAQKGAATRVADSFKGERICSIGSRTDSELNRRESFASKAVSQVGSVEGSLGVGYACHKGLKPQQPNYDSCFSMRVDERYCLYGCADGHGKKELCHFVKEKLPKFITQDARFGDAEIEQLLRHAFQKVQAMIESEFDAKRSGTTMCIVVHDRDKERFCSVGLCGPECRSEARIVNFVPATVQGQPVELELEGLTAANLRLLYVL